MGDLHLTATDVQFIRRRMVMVRKPSRFLDVTIGQVFGRLTIQSEPFKCRKWGQWMVTVKCECGVVKPARIRQMMVGNVKSCGCLNKERHDKFYKLLSMKEKKNK